MKIIVALCLATLTLLACSSSNDPTTPGPAPGQDTQPGPAPDGWTPTPTPDTGAPGADTLAPQPDTLARDTSAPRDGAAPQPDQGTPSYSCGPNDGECPTNDSYKMPCTDGLCIGQGCCCPQARLCGVGGFPHCCDPGQTCKSMATGECG